MVVSFPTRYNALRSFFKKKVLILKIIQLRTYLLKMYDKAHSSTSGNELIMVVSWKWYKISISVL